MIANEDQSPIEWQPVIDHPSHLRCQKELRSLGWSGVIIPSDYFYYILAFSHTFIFPLPFSTILLLWGPQNAINFPIHKSIYTLESLTYCTYIRI